jgi:hypothetical protein
LAADSPALVVRCREMRGVQAADDDEPLERPLCTAQRSRLFGDF